MPKWPTNLQAGDRFHFTGLSNEDLGSEERIITIIGISVPGDIQFRLEMFTSTGDRIGNPSLSSAPLLTALEMVKQGIWKHVTD